jgi:kynurenine formamidase
MRFSEIIDLSRAVYPGCPVWPTHPDFKVENTKVVERDGYTLHVIQSMSTHTGTHVDFPAHFVSGGRSIDDYAPIRFVGDAVIMNLQNKKPREYISYDDLAKYGKHIKPDTIVLLDTGWHKKAGKNDDYLFFWPYLSLEAAKYLGERKIKAVGIEGLSIAGWGESVQGMQAPIAKDSARDVHLALLERDVLIIEELANLESVRKGKDIAKCFVTFFPLKLQGMEGAPCRVIAFV